MSPKAVETEFNELKRHSEFSRKCAICTKTNQKCLHPPASIFEKMGDLLRKRTMKPFVILMIIYTLSSFTGTYAMRPYIVFIFDAYGTPINPNYATAILGFTSMVGTTTCVVIIRSVGKRKLFLGGILLLSIPKIALGEYIHLLNTNVSIGIFQIFYLFFQVFMDL